MRWAIVTLGLILGSAVRLLAQDQIDPAVWTCEQEQCTETTGTTFYEVTGTFQAGHRIAVAENSDLVAALEQQSQREFEFLVGKPVRIRAEIALDDSYRPADWPGPDPQPLAEPLLFVSGDGKSFTLLDAGDTVPVGSVVLATVRQVFAEAEEGVVTYEPARWNLRLSQNRVLAAGDVATAPPAADVPELLSADGDPDPEAEAAASARPPVIEGAARLQDITEPCSGPDCGADTAAATVEGNELAVELQRELARLGCYASTVDGQWGPISQRAMAAFNRAQGVDLATDRPSARALVEVSQAQGRVCPGE